MASTSLSRTSVSATNKKTWTLSMWFKRAGAGNSRQFVMRNIVGGGTSYLDMELLSSTPDVLSLFNWNGSTVFEFKTNQVFRDFNAWYHVVYACDTTQATQSDRFKMWVNGEQVTSFATATYPAQNADTNFLTADNLYFGTAGTSLYFEGQMSHAHMIEGTAYNADTFGEYDSTTGIWKPKTAPSVTYGGEGCFLKFENSGSMGTDSSGNGNNFTVNGTMTQTIDTPSNVFATLNPLSKSNATLTNGNTTGALTSNTDRFIPASTLKVSQGKWYAEFKLNSLTDHTGVGITGDEGKASNNNNAIGKETNSYAYVSTDGNFYDADSGSAYGSTYTSNDIIGIALDLDNNYIYFSKNGTWQNSGDPTSGATGTGGKAITDPASVPDGFYAMGVGSHSTGGVCNWSANFGNGYFGTTAVASAQNPDDGIGIFEFSPPTGYKALCTKSINAQEYS